jgi:bifunctional DNase/RNase
MREAEVRALLLDPTTKTPVLLLKDRNSTKAMPIWIGDQEAMSIAIELQGHTFPRPLSHDLMKELLNTLGGNLERAVITSAKEGTYYASLVIRDAGGTTRDIDARPSDAVALALRTRAPIFIEEAVFEKSAIESPFVEEEQFEEFVDNALKLSEVRKMVEYAPPDELKPQE